MTVTDTRPSEQLTRSLRGLPERHADRGRGRCAPGGCDPAAWIQMSSPRLPGSATASPFGGEEREDAVRMSERAAEAIEVLIRSGVRQAMNRFNGMDGVGERESSEGINRSREG